MIRFLGGREAGILPHGPQALGVHLIVNPSPIGGLSGFRYICAGIWVGGGLIIHEEAQWVGQQEPFSIRMLPSDGVVVDDNYQSLPLFIVDNALFELLVEELLRFVSSQALAACPNRC